MVLVLVLVQIRNWYGLWSVLVTGALVVAVTFWGSSQVQLVFAYLVTWFLLLGAPRAVIEMQAQRRRRRGAADTSDAGLLGRLTHTPGRPVGRASCSWSASARWCWAPSWLVNLQIRLTTRGWSRHAGSVAMCSSVSASSCSRLASGSRRACQLTIRSNRSSNACRLPSASVQCAQ